MLLGRLDTITIEQWNHHEFCAALFQHMDLQIEVVQEQLVEMYYGKDVDDQVAYFLTIIVISSYLFSLCDEFNGREYVYVFVWLLRNVVISCV